MLKKLMAGRNGMDRLSFILIIFFLLLYPVKYLYILGAIFLGIAIFRIFSKDISKRRMELAKYDQMTYRQFMFLNKLFSVCRVYCSGVRPIMPIFCARSSRNIVAVSGIMRVIRPSM